MTWLRLFIFTHLFIATTSKRAVTDSYLKSKVSNERVCYEPLLYDDKILEMQDLLSSHRNKSVVMINPANKDD
jgi:hypothetical protein